MSKSKLFFFCTLLFVLIQTTAAYSEFYKWVDENGTTHYSEFPPPDTNLENVYDTYKANEDKTSINRDNKKVSEESDKPIQNQDNKSKEIILKKSDIVGKWVHLGGSDTFKSSKLIKPYKPQSWVFTQSGTVTYRIGNKKNSFPYQVKGNLIITEPMKKQYRSFEVVAKGVSTMIWKDPIFGGYIHVRRGY